MAASVSLPLFKVQCPLTTCTVVWGRCSISWCPTWVDSSCEIDLSTNSVDLGYVVIVGYRCRSCSVPQGCTDDGGGRGWGRGWTSRPLLVLVLLMSRHLSCKSPLKLEKSGPLGHHRPRPANRATNISTVQVDTIIALRYDRQMIYHLFQGRIHRNVFS